MEQSNHDGSSSAPTASRGPATARQVKACNICRQTKIKCIMPTGIPPCERCNSRGLTCEKSTEVSGSETARLLESVVGDVTQLQTAVDVLLRLAGLPNLAMYGSSPVSVSGTHTAPEPPGDTGGDQSLPTAPIRTPLSEEDNSPYALPVSSLYEVTRLPALRNPRQAPSTVNETSSPDFIARGDLPLGMAQELFRQFTTRLDFFCYGITCPHDTLESMRSSSPLLTAAVCTVAALHRPQGSSMFQTCHAEFLKLVMARMFSISYSVDDVRALIIGCWWLGNIAYTLLGHTIRIATRLDYHLAYYSVVNHTSGEEETTKARLWYILFVMDHHSSVLYGRPALLSPLEEVHSQWELFIREMGHGEVDLRVSSQVALYHLIAKANGIYGSPIDKPFPEHCLPQLQGTFADIDRWYMVWGNRMPRNAQVGWFARDGAILNYHFARLHLCSHVFRGVPSAVVTISSSKLREYASTAVQSASATLQLVLERDGLRTALVGMPIYFHGMINFAAVFLIKALRNGFWGLTVIDVSPIFALLQSYIGELKSQDAAQQHLVYHIAHGLETMMQGLLRTSTDETFGARATEETIAQLQATSPEGSMFNTNTFDVLQGLMGVNGAASNFNLEF